MALQRHKLRDWIERRLTELPLATRFELHHEGRFGLNRICELKLDESQPIEDAPGALERTITETVGDHVSGFPGRQQYMVRGFAGEQPTGEFPFGMTASSFSSDLAESVALVTPEMDMMRHNDGGAVLTHAHAQVMVQQMRHNEALMRGLVEVTTRHAERDAEIIATLGKQNQEYADRSLSVQSMMEDMLSQEQIRRLADQKFQKDEDRKARLMKRLETMVLPHLAAKAGLLPAASTSSAGSDGGSDSAAKLKALFFSLDPETQNEMTETLGPDKTTELLAIFKEIGEREKAHAEANTETRH